MKFNKVVKENVDNKNGFLIACVCSILLLLTLCYFGVNSDFKGTSAATTCPSGQKMVDGYCCPASHYVKIGSESYVEYTLSYSVSIIESNGVSYCAYHNNNGGIWYGDDGITVDETTGNVYCSVHTSMIGSSVLKDDGWMCTKNSNTDGYDCTTSDLTNCAVNTNSSVKYLSSTSLGDNCVQTTYSSCSGLDGYDSNVCWHCPSRTVTRNCYQKDDDTGVYYYWRENGLAGENLVSDTYCELYAINGNKTATTQEHYSILAAGVSLENCSQTTYSSCSGLSGYVERSTCYSCPIDVGSLTREACYFLDGFSTYDGYSWMTEYEASSSIFNYEKTAQYTTKEQCLAADEEYDSKQYKCYYCSLADRHFWSSGTQYEPDGATECDIAREFIDGYVTDESSCLALDGSSSTTFTSHQVKITGTNTVGQTLTATTTTSPSDGVTYTYQWYANPNSSAASTNNAVKISGATSKNYTIADAYVGKYIYVVVTAKKSGYIDKIDSDITDATNNGTAAVAASSGSSDTPNTCEGSVSNDNTTVWDEDSCNDTYINGKLYVWSSSKKCCLIRDKYSIGYAYNGGTAGENAPKYGIVEYGSLPSTIIGSEKYDYVLISKPSKTVKITGNKNGTNAIIGSTTSKTQTFAGWTFSGGNTSTAKYGTSSSSITTSWSNASTKVTVQYFKNLASKSGASVKMTANWTPVAMSVPTITSPSGYNCTWNTKSDGSGTTYTSGQSYTPSATSESSITLYARCTSTTTELKNASLTVEKENLSLKVGDSASLNYTYSGDTTNSVITCSSANESAVTCKVENGKLKITTVEKGSSIVTINASATSTHKAAADSLSVTVIESSSGGTITEKTFTATFDANGGRLSENGSKSCKTTSNECEITDLPTATRDGYTFKGWGTGKTCTDGTKDKLTLDTNKKYYACWSKNNTDGGSGDTGTTPNPDVDGEGNVNDNVQTGDIAMAFVIFIGMFALGYAVYYFRNIKQN